MKTCGQMGDGYTIELPDLTYAQSRVATLVAAGYSNREIAATTGTTLSTVKNHLNAIYRQGKVVNRQELTHVITQGARTT
jgi:DNA-binding NarL/FixJ family response regulator